MARFVFWKRPEPALRLAAPLYADLAALQMRLALTKLALKAGFDPNQPRLRPGTHGGGRWVGDDDGGGSSQKPLTETEIDQAKFDSDHAQVLARAATRKPFVLAGGGSTFQVAPNPSANSDAPWYELTSQSQVGAFNGGIEYVAAKEGVDPNLIRTIMYMETTHGWYDNFALGANDTILPMNVSVSSWGSAMGLSRRDLQQPLTNIEAGAKVLKGITENLPPNSPVSMIATLYNVLGAPKVNNYGARAQKVFETQPWKNL